MQAFSAVKRNWLPQHFYLATHDEINRAVDKSVSAFQIYKNASPKEKIFFLKTIAQELTAIGEPLVKQAMLETGLSESRLKGELNRTIFQLLLFADVIEEGSWVEAIIDTAMPQRKPLPRPDLRKMLVPLGPVVVFGAGNFPLAFSTAGGDTVSALAAGNTVIIKVHPSHPGTNELVAAAIMRSVQKCNMPDGIFSSLMIKDPADAILLVKNPKVKAIGFTGSYNAGMAIYKVAVNERENPIPVYAEMSSSNQVLILPEKLKLDCDALASKMAGSVTLDAGQFSTNLGLIFLIKDEASKLFFTKFVEIISAIPAATMLNDNICKTYYVKRNLVADQKGVITLLKGPELSGEYMASTTVLLIKGNHFIDNPTLQNEIFGPATLNIECKNKNELLKAISVLHGQLTGSIWGTNADSNKFSDCISILQSKVGRIIFDGVPTGVEVCNAMMHGGPFPATNNAFYTSVGSDAIKRFARPLCFQDCPGELLPEALQNKNSLNIMRKLNGHFNRDS